ncbi:hypothetical protein C8R42DRAFT_661951 [Lentinula raphanica]|nr:hypothetical protein C8R42DRAFT_661951 [Lentinula raphanica]
MESVGAQVAPLCHYLELQLERLSLQVVLLIAARSLAVTHLVSEHYPLMVLNSIDSTRYQHSVLLCDVFLSLVRCWPTSASSLASFPRTLLYFLHLPTALLVIQLSLGIRLGFSTMVNHLLVVILQLILEISVDLVAGIGPRWSELELFWWPLAFFDDWLGFV